MCVNCNHNRPELKQRQNLDRRHLEDGFFQYALLNVCSWYSEILDLSQLRMHASIKSTLLTVLPKFHKAFSMKYAGMNTSHWQFLIIVITGHCCKRNGCGSVLVIDGNMKNHRQICSATDAGYTTFDGLPGKVKTGCINSPDHKSWYCTLHSPNISVSCPFSDDGDELFEMTNHEGPIAMILSKRTTRQNTFYKVNC
jgi:hypothetical protein